MVACSLADAWEKAMSGGPFGYLPLSAPWIARNTVFVGSAAGTTLTVEGVNAGTVTAGQPLAASPGIVLLPGTQITGQLSGTTGGPGQYTLSAPVSAVPHTRFWHA